MSTQRVTQSEVSVDEQAVEHEADADLRPSVEQEIQAKVAANHPDGIVQECAHMPLEQEERIRAREAELERIPYNHIGMLSLKRSERVVLNHPPFDEF